ncbi:hypothetical protein LJR296_001469 [Cupriavidus necator]|uniref:hypothetical protein n=1 Tax=Cupriavidus necator TaxID=106590 RepID=UPI003ECC1B94
MIAIFDIASGMVRRTVNCPNTEIIYNIGLGEDYITVQEVPQGPARVVGGQIELIPSPPAEPTYADLRRAAYPPIGDQLDAIWKTFAMLDPAQLDPDTLAMLNLVEAIKSQYPEPSASN